MATNNYLKVTSALASMSERELRAAASALASMSEPELRAWLNARVRAPCADFPYLESPDDLLRLIYAETHNTMLRVRLEQAILAALDELCKIDDLGGGPDAWAAQHLAALAEGIDLCMAVPLLREISERGAFGGHDGVLQPAAEEMVLLALASLQPRGLLWPQWEALWRRDVPRLWPVVTVGLRLSAAVRALAILPEAVERAVTHAGFPLGEVLWACATEPPVTDADVAKALAGLSPAAKAQCRVALNALGAESGQLAGWGLSGQGRDRG